MLKNTIINIAKVQEKKRMLKNTILHRHWNFNTILHRHWKVNTQLHREKRKIPEWYNNPSQWKNFWRYNYSWFQLVLQRFSSKFWVLLAQKQTGSLMALNQRLRKNSYIYGHMKFFKEARNIQWKKKNYLTNCAALTRYYYVEDCHYIHVYNSVWKWRKAGQRLQH